MKQPCVMRMTVFILSLSFFAAFTVSLCVRARDAYIAVPLARICSKESPQNFRRGDLFNSSEVFMRISFQYIEGKLKFIQSTSFSYFLSFQKCIKIYLFKFFAFIFVSSSFKDNQNHLLWINHYHRAINQLLNSMMISFSFYIKIDQCNHFCCFKISFGFCTFSFYIVIIQFTKKQ